MSNICFGEYVCATPEDTLALGEKFGRELRGGAVVLLEGELGAGKTVFVKGVLTALDYDAAEVTSPTFALVNVYAARIKVYHLDLYRLNANVGTAYAVGLDEILQDETAAVLIEWAQRLTDFSLPENTIKISIAGDGDDARRIAIKLLDDVQEK